MNSNPYSAPANPYEQPTGGGGGPTNGAQSWEATEVMGQAWAIFKVHALVLVGATFVAALIQNILSRVVGTVTGAFVEIPASGLTPGVGGVSGMETELILKILSAAAVGMVIVLPVTAFFRAGIIKLMLSPARGGVPNFGDVFGGASRTLPLLLAMILKGLIVFVGCLLLIIPGIYASFALSQVEYFVVDRQMGPIEAIQASWSATEGQKIGIFIYWLLSLVVAILGLLACCVGVLAAIPVIELGAAIIFTRITGTAVQVYTDRY